MVRYLHKHFSSPCAAAYMIQAAYWGHFSVLTFLYANRSGECEQKAIWLAFLGGHLEILRWLAFLYPELYNPSQLLQLKQVDTNPVVIYWVKHGHLPGTLPQDKQ